MDLTGDEETLMQSLFLCVLSIDCETSDDKMAESANNNPVMLYLTHTALDSKYEIDSRQLLDAIDTCHSNALKLNDNIQIH